MIEIEIPGKEYYDEINNEFVNIKPQRIKLEHSLVSISKWESIWMKPFLDSEKTIEEIVSYVQCMNLTQNVNPITFSNLSEKNVKDIRTYMDSPRTATTIVNHKKSYKKEIITSELIYYWMVSYNIPFSCEKWHLNRLLTLINVCSAKNNPEKMSKGEAMRRQKEINEARRKARVH